MGGEGNPIMNKHITLKISCNPSYDPQDFRSTICGVVCSSTSLLENLLYCYKRSLGSKSFEVFFFFFFSILFYFFLLYNIVLVLPYINMHLPRVYMYSPSWTPLPPPSPYHPSGSSQCTSPKLPVSWIKPGLAIRFLYDIIHVLMPFSQIIPHSTTESKRLQDSKRDTDV